MLNLTVKQAGKYGKTETLLNPLILPKKVLHIFLTDYWCIYIYTINLLKYEEFFGRIRRSRKLFGFFWKI